MLIKNIPLGIVLSFIAVTLRAQNSNFDSSRRDFKNFSSFQVDIQPDMKKATFDLLISNPRKEKLQLVLTHSLTGMTIDTTITTEQFSRRYNFNEADDGEYIIKISNGKEKFSKQIELTTVTTRNLILH